MGQGGELGDALQSSLLNTLAAASFNAVGDYTKNLYADGSVQKIMIHAMVGGLLAQLSGGDFKSGALAAGANEALVDQLNTWVSGDQNLLNMSSQLVGMLAAATQSDVDADSLQKGAWVAQNATQYNYLNHDQLAEAAKELRACANATCREEMVARYKDLSFAQDLEAAAACSASPASCAAYSKEVANTMANLDDIYQTLGDGPTQEWETLRQSNLGFQDMLATFTAGHTSASIAEAMQQKWGLSDEETKVVAENLVLVAGGGVAAIVAKKALSAVKAKSDEGAKATGGAAGKVDDLASTGTPVRPTPQKSEIDVGADLGAGARPQVSYKNGQEVPYGTSGSVRPDWCVGNVCSVEVKNYNIAKNQSGLISNVSKQAIQRAENLPQGMQQQVVIDVRGQMITVDQERNIIKGIVQKSNGAIKPEAIEFKRN